MNFRHDAAGRLKTTTNHRGMVTTNTYNLRGQVTKVQAPESVTTYYVYDTSGRVTDVKRSLGTGVFVAKQGYDDAGRVVWHEDNALRRTNITYDDVGRTVQVTSPDGRIGKRFFDAAGRVNKVIRGVGSPEEITEETGYNTSGTTAWVEDGSGALLRRYINGSGIDERLVFLKYDTATGGINGRWYFHGDHQGSVIGMVSSGYTWKAKYDEFGVLVAGGTPAPFGYTGRRYDADTGLYYYRARFYKADIGRFLRNAHVYFTSFRE